MLVGLGIITIAVAAITGIAIFAAIKNQKELEKIEAELGPDSDDE